ncbi:MAG: carboxylate-amine ligase, partial [Burkholderiales bacterium]|nr:carboxylate-amine ligase [Burkholderiales bacterium]
MIKEPSFTVGIEEEYLVVDRKTRDLINEAPPTMLSECEK